MDGGKYMWLFVMFDLPSKLKHEKKTASQFRRFLLNDGYIMLQFSVYARIVRGDERIKKHLKKVNEQIPPRGNIKVLQITDMQYGRMLHLVNGKNEEKNEQSEQITKGNQLLLF